MPVEEAIHQRRSVREFTDQTLTLEQIGRVCWAAQGISDRQLGLRTSPSAGALYPVELYVVTAEGVDHYLPKSHSLERHFLGDCRPLLERAALEQEAIGDAPACMVIAAVVERAARKYHGRAERYCFMEAGHIAQNILLQAAALQLSGVPIAAFQDEEAAEALRLPKDHRLLYLVPLGHPQGIMRSD